MCSGYQLLTSQDSATVGTSDDLIWHKKVPLKVSILAWRLLHDRLPTKSNLLNRGILSHEAAICSDVCGQAETASHLFLQCDTYASMWQLVRSWLGVSGVDPPSLHDHFFSSVYSLSRWHEGLSIFPPVGVACVRVVNMD